MKEYSCGTGRQTSAARVFVSKGTGQISVNAKSLEDFSEEKLLGWWFVNHSRLLD